MTARYCSSRGSRPMVVDSAPPSSLRNLGCSPYKAAPSHPWTWRRRVDSDTWTGSPVHCLYHNGPVGLDAQLWYVHQSASQFSHLPLTLLTPFRCRTMALDLKTMLYNIVTVGKRGLPHSKCPKTSWLHVVFMYIITGVSVVSLVSTTLFFNPFN